MSSAELVRMIQNENDMLCAEQIKNNADLLERFVGDDSGEEDPFMAVLRNAVHRGHYKTVNELLKLSPFQRPMY
jgi:hypothetical protein